MFESRVSMVTGKTMMTKMPASATASEGGASEKVVRRDLAGMRSRHTRAWSTPPSLLFHIHDLTHDPAAAHPSTVPRERDDPCGQPLPPRAPSCAMRTVHALCAPISAVRDLGTPCPSFVTGHPITCDPMASDRPLAEGSYKPRDH